MAGDWLKNNAFLVAAIALPVVIVALFAIATALPRLWVEDPAHDLLFSTTRYQSAGNAFGIAFEVRSGTLVATVSYHARPVATSATMLYRFDPQSGRTTPIAYEIPAAVRERLRAQAIEPDRVATEEVTIEIGQDVRLIGGASAPDGWTPRGSRGSPGLFGELFGMGGSRGRGFGIEKDGRVIPVPIPDTGLDLYYGNPEVLGWIEDRPR